MVFENTPAGMFPAVGESPIDSAYLVVPGEPVSKERPRFNPKSGSAYTPAKTRTAEKVVSGLYSDECGIQFTDPVSLSITCFVSNRRRRDVDNMGKLILDALNGVAYVDDSQVHDLIVRKRYTSKERARVEVSIHVVNDLEESYVVEEVSESYADWETIKSSDS
jgi:Holliday junction resolvase RusA-like endonuclease